MTKTRSVKTAAIRGTDWARVDAFTEADIERMAKADPENRPRMLNIGPMRRSVSRR